MTARDGRVYVFQAAVEGQGNLPVSNVLLISGGAVATESCWSVYVPIMFMWSG